MPAARPFVFDCPIFFMRSSNKMTRSHAKRLIVLISDSPLINKIITTSLSRNGYEVRTFKNPFSVLDKLSAMQAHLILMRTGMKSMDELELIINIRDLKVACPILVIEEQNSRRLPASRADIYKRLGCRCIPALELNILKASGGLTPQALAKKVRG